MAVNFLTLLSNGTRSIAVQNLRYSTITGSTITVSTLSGSTLFGSTMVLSSLNASQITVSTLTGSTLSGSTMVLSSLNASQVTVSTLTGSTLSGSTMVLSSLNASQVTVSTLTGSTLFGSTMVMSTMTATGLALSTLTVSTINGALPGAALTSTIVSIGASTNATYNNFSSGSYAVDSWVATKSGMTGATKTVMSATGQYQLIVAAATSGLFLSSDSGITWTPLTGGLPVLTGSAYWSDGVISANGQYITLSIYGGSLWMSADYGRTFALTNQPTPNIWLPLNGNTNDIMGGTAATMYGSLAYTTVNYPGYTTQAVNLANTIGGTATKYIRGTWTGASNFTVSFWFNSRSDPNTGVHQSIFSAYQTKVFIGLGTAGQIYANIPSGGGNAAVTLASTGFNLSQDTWYYVTYIFQTNGTCSFYVNNNLIGSVTNTDGVGSLTTSVFELSGLDSNQTLPFNGYIADLRITNSVSAYVPIPLLQPNIWISLEGFTVDYAAINGSVPFITGFVGSYASSFTGNTAGGIANNFIKGLWLGASNFTVSCWVNFQSYNGSANTSIIFSAYNASMTIYMDGVGKISAYIPTGGGTNGAVLGSTPSAVSLNTWYHIHLIFQTGGLCSLYVNGALIGSLTNSSGLGSYTTTTFCLGTYDNSNTINAFSGYMDDIRIYNAAIPIHTLLPQNYRSLALSGTGQYALAAASDWVVGSSDSSKTWAKQSVNVGTQASLSINHTGQYQMVATGPAAGSIMPQLSGLAASTWTQSGVNWRASGNVEYYPAYRAFNNLNASAADKWETLAAYTGGSFSYGGTATTSIQTIGSVGGDWLQIQSSIPLVLTSYSIGANDLIGRSPKTYYIVGSNDGSTWYPIQYCNFTTIPFTATFTTTSYITVNLSGTQSITAGQTVSATTITYTFTTNAYTYFRMVTTHLFSEILINIGEWNMNFSNSVSYSTNYGTTWLNTSSTVSNESVALSASGQYALSTNSVAPFARLTLDNTNVDTYGILVPATGLGTVTYSTSIKTVGTHSAQFANATAGGTPTIYLNYTLPGSLIAPSVLTMACWVYPTSISLNVTPMSLCSGTTYGNHFFINSSGVNFYWASTTNNAGTSLASTTTISLNTWTHIAMTYTGSVLSLYVNGINVASTNVTGRLCLAGGGNLRNILIGSAITSYNAFAGYIDDVRIYTSALSATAIRTLYNNPTITQSQIVAVSSSYLPITSYTFPTLSGISTATVVDTAVSQTGQYMVAVTSGTTNNVYYSTDFGATFTALTFGSSAMTSCSISYDGSYLTVENNTTVYTRNLNVSGYTVAVGNQAGQFNQSINSIAIGNQAGQSNQSANSIVLNGTGSVLNATGPGLYVAPIATIASSLSESVSLLGYGTDGQVVRTGISVTSAGDLISPIDAIAQGPYLLPSPANRDMIIKWLQKTVSTVTPVAGVPSFWASRNTYGTIAAGTSNFAYAGGVLLPDGRVVFVPTNATTIGLFNPTTNTYSTIAGAPGGTAYHGGVLLPDGRVLFVPQSASTIGLFNPITNTYSTVTGGSGYNGGVLVPDGRVVFVPSSAGTIGLFNPTTNTYSTVAGGTGYGGGVLLPDGRVVFVPRGAGNIGIFNPITNTFSTVASFTGVTYRGGVLLPDGRVVFVPFSGNKLGIFDPINNSYYTIDITNAISSDNNYAGGVLLPDGRVVLVPGSSTAIGLFDPTTNTCSMIGGAPGLGAYQGGVLLPDGRVVFVPQNASTIGLFLNNIPAPKDLCLHPFFNKY